MSRSTVLAAVGLGLLLLPGSARAGAIVKCPFGPGSGDRIDRGFYIQDFPATVLDRVLLKLSARQAGVYVLSLTARAGTFDGALVGQAFASFASSGDSQVGQTIVFDFHGVAAPQGGVVTFAIKKVAGPDTLLLFDVSSDACTGAVVVQTEDTTPPLSTVRRDRVGLVVLGPEPETAMGKWVPVVARVPGYEGSRWRSDLMIRNRGSATATLTLHLHTTAGMRSRGLTLAAGEQVVKTDVVDFIDPAFVGSAPLEVVSDHPLDVTSRTYNLLAPDSPYLPGATFGQGYPGMRPREGFADGQTAVLIGLAEWSDFRTNLGLTNTSTSPAQVVVRLYDDLGTLVHTTSSITIGPGQWRQLSRPFKELAGRQNVRSGRAEVEVRAGTGVLVHASLIDQRTSDAATLWATP